MTTYYIDASSSFASDKNTGLSAATPFASLDAVNKLKLQPGDTVAFKAGTTYATTASGAGSLVIKAVGTLDKPITFTSYGTGDAPIIKNLASGYSDGIQLVGAKYVTIDGLNITGASQAGINVDKNSSNIHIQNVESSGVGEGVILNGTSSLVTHSYFHDLKMIKNTANIANDDYGAVGVMIGGSNNEISFNKIVNASAQSYDYGKDGGGFELFGNVSNVSIHDNWVENSDGFLEAGGPGQSLSNITITNNVSLNNGVFAVVHNGSGVAKFSNVDASRNTIVNEKSQPKDMAVVYLDAAGSASQFNFHDNSVYLNSGDSVFKQNGTYHSNNTFYLASSVTHLYNNWSMTLNSGEALGKLTGTASGAALVAAVQTQSGHGAPVTVSSQAGLTAVVHAVAPVVVAAVAPVVVPAVVPVVLPAIVPVVAPVVVAAVVPVAVAAVAAMTSAVVAAPVPLVIDTNGITGQSYVSEHKVLNASGSVVLLERYHADGTKDYSQSVGPNGAVTYQNYDAAGKLIQQAVANSDGSRIVDVYGVKGQSYTTAHSTYDARGVLTSLSQYHADGTKDYTTVLSLDGSTTTQKYDASGLLSVKTVTAANGASVTTSFTKNGVVTGTVEKNAAGIQTHTVTYHTDGTRDYATDLNSDGSTAALKYDVSGILATKNVVAVGGTSVMTSFDKNGLVTATVEKNAAGVQTHTVAYHTDGTKDYATDLNADGSTTALKYDASGILATKNVVAVGGASVMTSFDKNGTVTNTVEKNAAGVQIHTVSYHADGTKDYATDLNANGSTTALKYDAAGKLALENIAQKDGSSVQNTYNPAGALTGSSENHKDGSLDVYQYNIVGKSYNASHVSYDASKHLQFSEMFNNDGSHTANLSAANVTVAATAAKDVFTAYGADTFNFGAGSGKDTIYNFHAGASASHDTISLSKSVASDFAHLTMHQAGTDVVIDLSAQDSITLKSVSMAALTHHDFLFV